MNKTSRRAPAQQHGKQMPRAKAPAIAAALRNGPKAPGVRPPQVKSSFLPGGLSGPRGEGQSMDALVAPVMPGQRAD
jgi:hypothetical protein